MRDGGHAGHALPVETRLLDRDTELAALDAVLEGLAAGRPRLVMFEGPAGIGKTSLLAELRSRAVAAGLNATLARGSELDRDFPYSVVRQLFETRVVSAQTPLSGAAAPARTVFAPAATGERDDPEAAPSFATLHGLYWLAANLTADGPWLLAVDDLHWCDASSLRFLTYLVRRLDGLPIVIACTLRRFDPGAEPALVGELAADPLAVSIPLPPLSRAAVAEFVSERLSGEVVSAFTDACWTATGGNPLLLGELLKGFVAEGAAPDAARIADLGPRAVSRTVLSRLARLPPAAIALARAAAVLGDGADFAAATALAGVGADDAATAVRALQRAELLRPRPHVEFEHPLVRAAVYDDVTPPERAVAHEAAARLLADAGAPPEQVASHVLALSTRGQGWVVDALTGAARAALRAGASDSAVAYLTRALAEPPPIERRAEVLVALGRAELQTNGADAVEHLRAAYEALPGPVERAEVAALLGRSLLYTGRVEEAADVVRRAAAPLGAEHADLRAALEAFELMTVYFGAGDPEQLKRLEPYRSRPVGDGPGAKMLAVMAAREWSFSGGPSIACAALARAALADGVLLEADPDMLSIVAMTTLGHADAPDTREAWETALAVAHRRGSLLGKCCVDWGLAFTLQRRGELAEAEQAARTAAEEFALWGLGPAPGEIDCVALLAAALREQGRIAEARAALDRFEDPGDRSDSARYWLDSSLEQLLAEGRYDAALAVADDFAARFAYLRNPIDTPWQSHRALALAGLGRREHALAAAEADLELALRWGAPGSLGRALRVLGTFERDERRLRDAVDAVAGSPARLEHAKALTALGGLLRRARRRREAREPLREALELAEACGARGLVAQVRSELHAAGGRPRTSALRGIAALTAGERRVAHLAAKGATNREIAQALFITPKTVEIHLGNAYRKLGIVSRRELPGELAESP